MRMVELLRRIRGKMFGLNLVINRLDELQAKFDQRIDTTESDSERLITPTGDTDRTSALSECSDPLLESSTEVESALSVSPDVQAWIEFSPSTRGSRIRVVFLVLAPELWPSVEPVWRRACEDTRFSVSVVLLKMGDPDTALEALSKARRMLENAGIPYFTEHTFSLESSRPHVIFYPSPYSSLYPERYKPEVVAAAGHRIAYISYGLEVGGGAFNARYQYDSDVPRLAWRIFARTTGQLSNFARYCSYGSGHVVVTGHPRAELGSNAFGMTHRAAIEKARGRTIIAWTPHFSVFSRRKWSSFLDYQEFILKLMDDRPSLFLLIRPHPLLRSALAKVDGWSESKVTDWFNSADSRQNVHVDIEADYRPAFAASNALMADAGSFLVEYLHTGKPICYLQAEADIGLSEETRELACFYPGASETDIARFFDMVENNEDELRDARVVARRTYFGPLDTTPSQKILDHIASNIEEPPARKYTSLPPATALHDKAFQYWVKATTSFLAPESYYLEQEKQLRHLLSTYAAGRFAVDIGCGNGRFTQIISEYFEFIEAMDPNQHLVNQARENAAAAGIQNIEYMVERLESPETLSSYDFVCCMGVTSNLIDDEVFLRSIWKLKAAMREGAILLMKDTVSMNATQIVEWNDYHAIYRNVSSYIAAFEAADLKFVTDQVIAEDGEKQRTNRFFVFSL